MLARMRSLLTRTPGDWAQVCRLHASQARDPATKLFLEELAREFELVAVETMGSHKSGVTA